MQPNGSAYSDSSPVVVNMNRKFMCFNLVLLSTSGISISKSSVMSIVAHFTSISSLGEITRTVTAGVRNCRRARLPAPGPNDVQGQDYQQAVRQLMRQAGQLVRQLRQVGRSSVDIHTGSCYTPLDMEHNATTYLDKSRWDKGSFVLDASVFGQMPLRWG